MGVTARVTELKQSGKSFSPVLRSKVTAHRMAVSRSCVSLELVLHHLRHPLLAEDELLGSLSEERHPAIATVLTILDAADANKMLLIYSGVLIGF
jgi:hypothetical protein